MAGVLWSRGVEFAAALIGVVKTGAGYTLLDPDFPDERLRSAATDAGIGILVSEPRLAARLTGPWDTAACSPGNWPSSARTTWARSCAPMTWPA
ncbi:hypothetical protein O1L60_01240 [Streptomyces diastatochromogenes]|nr:hypothetical protein [Streptomyces diastatochromogenes]